MEEQDPCQFSGRVEIGPVNSGSTVTRVEHKSLERCIEGS
jgi:hypothetical protein